MGGKGKKRKKGEGGKGREEEVASWLLGDGRPCAGGRGTIKITRKFS